MYFLFFAAVLFFCHAASSNTIHQRIVRQAEVNSCQTPWNTTGSCVSYKQCVAFLKEVTPGLDSQKVAYSKGWMCGKVEERKVCCEKTLPTTTTQKTTTTTRKAPIISLLYQSDHSLCGYYVRYPKLWWGDEEVKTTGSYPFIVALGSRMGINETTLWRCGGTLISDRWVITAGHCVHGNGILNLTTVRMGDLNLDEESEDGASPVDYEIESVILHPQFVLSPLENDLALVRLSQPVNFTINIRPVCLLQSSDQLNYKIDDRYKNMYPRIIGWGHENSSFTATGMKKGSKMLRETGTFVVNKANCTERYKQITLNPVDVRSLCVREEEPACHDDSGWPLITLFLDDGIRRFYLLGIASFGGGCIGHSFPTVFTKVPYFLDWISNVTEIKVDPRM